MKSTCPPSCRQKPQKQDWILGNFSKPIELYQIETQNQLGLVWEFGSGVVRKF